MERFEQLKETLPILYHSHKLFGAVKGFQEKHIFHSNLRGTNSASCRLR